MNAKENKMDFQAIYNQAIETAKKAEADYTAKYGESYYCGFAWVDFPSARTPFVNWAKKNGVGSKHWKKGWSIWNPAGNFTQSMDIKEVGAQAFAQVLKSHGIECMMNSRPD
jgi:hypothetical protein